MAEKSLLDGLRESDVAIVGMSGRFPGSPDIESLWRNLREGVECITFFSDAELLEAGIPASDLAHPGYVRAAGSLADVELFDAGLFNLAPREAEITDPQHRIFLECAWQALEDAGCDPSAFPGPIGVYAGSGVSRYLLNVFSQPQVAAALGQARILHGNDRDFLATWVSYQLNLRGPSLTVQTACSTSLVAVHLAIQALLNGECDAALAGGVSVAPQQRSGYFYREGDILSPDGHCRAFDAQAQGTVGGNGAGVVVLRRLVDAVADGDRIRAVIKGSAINNDGSLKVGYTAPSIEGQARAISEALAVAGVEPASIGYVEAHGTGTPLGDPVEIAALGEAFGPTGARCAIGSVKTNLGHLDAAAGVTGLIKTALALEREEIPPSLHFTAPNPKIDLAGGQFYVNTRLQPWRTNGRPRRAGVSSFGIGGTNAHVVMEEAPRTPPPGPSRPWQLLVWSARTPEALEESTARLAAHLRDHPEASLPDVAFTLQTGRRAFEWRRLLVCRDTAAAAEALATGDPQKVLEGEVAPGDRPVAFLLPGQGTQHPGMGSELYAGEPVFRRELERCARTLQPLLGLDLLQVLYPPPGDASAAGARLAQTGLAQPALFAVELALARLWESWGVKPESLLGHSVGEYVAACLAGVLDPDDALRLVALRGHLMQELPAGAMLSVSLPAPELAPLLGDELSIAAVNAPEISVASGPQEGIARLERELAGRGVKHRRLHTSHAFHSRMVEPILERFGEAVSQVALQAPRLRWVSNLTGTWARSSEVTDPAYWVRHLRETVQFAAGARELLAEESRILLEVGPGRTLSSLARQQLPVDAQRPFLTSLPEPEARGAQMELLLRSLGRLWLNGVAVDWRGFAGDEGRRRVALPTYPFERRRYWVDRRRDLPARDSEGQPQRQEDPSRWFYLPTWRRTELPASRRAGDLARQPLRWLLLAGHGGPGERLAAELSREGREVTVAEGGARFARLGEGRYAIDPGRPEDYVALLRELAIQGRAPERIVHLWSAGPAPESPADCLDAGYYSLLHLGRALDAAAVAGPVGLAVVASRLFRVTGVEEPVPERATLLGPCRVLPQELPGLRCRVIEVAPAAPEEELAELLLTELCQPWDAEVVAWRGDLRWVQGFERMAWEQEAADGTGLRPGGVYLITGGLGGVGLALARHLVRAAGARLVLTARTGLPPRERWGAWLAEHAEGDATSGKIRRLQELEEMGGEVLALAADVADAEAMRGVLAAARERFGSLHGVIHAAGVVGDSALRSITELDRRESERQLRAKVQGTRVLAGLLRDQPLDFCLLVSSVASVLGGLGFAAYAAANQYLDAFAMAQGRGAISGAFPWISVGWDGWRFDDGPAGGEAAPAIAPRQGAWALQQILAMDRVRHVVVSTTDLAARRRRWVERPAAVAEPAAETTYHPRPRLRQTCVAPRNEVEEKIAGIWRDLLGLATVGVHDDFFELGGQSLLATQLFARLRQVLGAGVPLRTIFQAPTVAELAEVVLQTPLQAPAAEPRTPPPLVPVPRDQELPLSFAQQRLWFLEHFEAGTTAYVIQWPFRLLGPFSAAAFADVISEMVRRHETLRTTFHTVEDRTIQVVAPAARVPVPLIDLGGLPEELRLGELQALARRDGRRPFDLTAGPLLRVHLLRLGAEDHAVFLTMHHIVTDLLSLRVFVRELTTLYETFSEGRPSPLPELPVQYADYAVWQRSWLQGEVLAAELDFWKRKLADAAPVLELPTDRPRPPVRGFRGGVRAYRLPRRLSERLTALTQSEDSTLYMCVLAGFKALLYAWSRQRDVIVGTPVANRNHFETEDLIGFFVNTLVLRTGMEGDPTFRELLARVREVTLEALAHQDLPFEMLVDELGLERNLAYTSVFQVLFQMHHAVVENAQIRGLELRPLEASAEASQFDITLTVVEVPDGIVGTFQYNRDLFDDATIQRMADHYETLLAAAVETPDERLSALSMLREAERHQILLEWGISPAQPPFASCLHELFEAQAERSPEAVAILADDGEPLTYRQLDSWADRLTGALCAAGVGRGDLVGLCVERSPAMVAGMIAALKAGAAWVPLDPSHPREWLAHILADSGAAVVLAPPAWRERLAGLPARQVALLDAADLEAGGGGRIPDSGAGPADLAYVIYTSGSTGRPKGVMIPHRAICSLVLWYQAAMPLRPEDRFLQKTPFTFDVSVREIFWPLLCGSTLVLARPDGHRDSAYQVERIVRTGVTAIGFVPSLLRAFLDEPGLERCASLRLALCGGESLPSELAQRWSARLGARLINLYGPTEATVDATSWACRTQEGPGRSVRIGSPIAGLRAHVLDAALQPVGIGLPGELYLGGGGLARGYLGRPDLTAEKLVPDPFAGSGPGEAGDRLYRTGDLVRTLPDGTLEFLGRIDQQVKLRGVRIELGEIESVLEEHPGVARAVALVRSDGPAEQQLVAYVVPRPGSGSSPDARALRTWLEERLPEPMVPAACMLLAELPLTSSGKLDRKALPSPAVRPLAEAGGQAAPESPVEKKLAEIWREILHVERVGLHDDFFELGGDSILSLQAASRAREAGLSLKTRQIFEHRTIARLAQMVQPGAAAGPARPAETHRPEPHRPVPLTPIQQQLFDQDLADPHHYNQALLFQVVERVDGARLAAAVRALAGHHEALRTRFSRSLGRWRQTVEKEERNALSPTVDLAALPAERRSAAIEAAASAVQASLRLGEGPLLRTALFSVGEEEPQRLLLVAHHLVVDGVSWRILLDDLLTAYRQLERGEPVRLPAATTPFQQWALSLSEFEQWGDPDGQTGYWSAAPRGEVRPLPRDGGGGNTVAAARTVAVALAAEETRALLQEVPSAYGTRINDALLAALVEAFAPWTGSRRLLVDLEGHGREEVLASHDFSRTVGWFTTVFPVLLDLEGVGETGAALKSVKEQLRAVPQRGLGYGVLRYCLGGERAALLARLPQAEVLFNYLGQLDQALPEGSPFIPARESAGPVRSGRQQRSHPIEINASVIGGRLHVAWTYGPGLHDRATVERLAAGYLEALRALVAHCRSGACGFTPSDFPLAGLDQQALDRIAGPDRTIEDVYPLSPLQEGLLFHSLDAATASLYQPQLSCRLRGRLDEDAFARAWQAAVDRHSALRTAIVWEGVERPLQVVRRTVAVRLAVEDWSGLPEPLFEQRLRERREMDRGRRLPLAEPPLMRLTLIRRSAEARCFIWTHHHLAMDGWSAARLVREVLHLYESFALGRELRLEPARPYGDYVAWLQGQGLEAAEAFWRRALAGFTAPTPVGIRSRERGAPGGDEVYRDVRLELPEARTRAAEAWAHHHRLTLATLVQGLWAIQLSRASGDADIVFGSVTAGRPADLSGVERMVGLFINTLPVRARVEPDRRLVPWLDAMQAQQVEARQYEFSPLSQVQRWSEVPAGAPLFESLVVFENYPVAESVREGGTRVVEVDAPEFMERTSYPLTLIVSPGARLSLQLLYDVRRFDRTDVLRWLDHFLHLLDACLERPEALLDELEMLGAGERHQLLQEWNDTVEEWREDRLLHQLIEAQARRTPGAVALLFEGEAWTYRDLDLRANQLARYLRRLGVGPEVRVGVFLERSPEMVLALLATLKAGGAYVPLDPHYPQERLLGMLADADVGVLLTRTLLLERLSSHRARAVCLDAEQAAISLESGESPDGGAGPQSLAYVIFTSGSTGRPKGAMNTHEAIRNRILWMQRQYRLGAGDVVLQKTPFSFDVSVWEFFWPLMTGATLAVAVPEGHRDSAYLVEAIQELQVTTLHFVPSMLQAFLEEPGLESCTSLRRVVCSGEALPAALLQRCRERLDARVENLYGPTEAAVDVTFWPCPPDGRSPVVPIGRPISNVQIHVLGPSARAAGVGIPGELHIGGVALARGYLGRPDLTAERFIPDPFSSEAGARLYKTGDLVRSLPDGVIEFLGRIDHQVKIRGFRIELGEIEATIAGHPGVREAAVLLRQGGAAPRLVAYVVPREGEAVDPADLRSFLAQRLPDFMIPAVFAVLSEMPLTGSGKVDRRALPEPAPPRAREGEPRTETERKLAAIWREVLRLHRVGIEDSFFELGGDSILSIQIVAKARESGIFLTPAQIFEHRTIARLAIAAESGVAVESEQGPVVGPVPLLPIQHWFFGLELAEPWHWNQALLFEVAEELDVRAFAAAVELLPVHHDALRLRFVRGEDGARGWRQHLEAPGGASPFIRIDLSALPAARRGEALQAAAAALQGSLDLAAGPLLRAAVFACGAGESDRVLVVIHHLAVDGVSWRVLLEDLETAYRQIAGGAAVSLPRKTTSFKSWAERLERWASSPDLRGELHDWLSQPWEQSGRLPLDDPRGAATVGSTRTVTMALTEAETQNLLRRVPQAYRTEINEVLLTAVAQAVGAWTGRSAVLVDLEGHGREEIFPDLDLSRTVGWFTTLFPVVLDPGEAVTPGEALKAVKEQLRKIPRRGIGFGALSRLCDDPGIREALGALPPAEILFNFLGQVDQALPGSSPFRPARESSGPSSAPSARRSHPLDVTGIVTGGRLWLSWSHSPHVLRAAAVEALATSCLDALRALIRHCLAVEGGDYTPSDFPKARLSQDELGELLAELAGEGDDE